MLLKSIDKKTWVLLASVWSILIFIGCGMPGSNLPKLTVWDHFDKVVHFVLFGGCTYLWFMAFPKYLYRVAGLVLLFGIAIEFYQKYFVPGRSFDVWDILADALGICVFSCICWASAVREKSA
jgi:VanZ family protein